jgi:DNA-binding NarL/FixJ family response regulator
MHRGIRPDLMAMTLKSLHAALLAASPKLLRVESSWRRSTRLLASLSRREVEVLAASLTGRPIKTIARELRLKQGTVETYRYRIYRKLGVQNMIQLALTLASVLAQTGNPR